MNIEKKIACSLYEIETMLLNGETYKAIEAIQTLREVSTILGRNNEVISVSYSHDKETVEKAKRENDIILHSDTLPHEMNLTEHKFKY
jgi:hypothetical protein